MLTNNKRWEIGSDFDCSEEILISSPTSFWLPAKYQLFSTATASFLALKTVLQKPAGKPLRIHVPSFYCLGVVSKLQTVFEVCWYRDLPGESSPDFDTLKPLSGDLVIVVNLFGIKSQQPWQDWQKEHPNIILVEDHSHDPFSPWAKNSQADYATSSLRKTLPIPDGGILWSPKNLPLPQPFGKESPGAYKKLMAMILKRSYLQGLPINKDDYLRLSRDGQNELDDETNSAISVFTNNVLRFLDVESFRQQRAANISKFINLTLNQNNPYWKPLFANWEQGSVPFNSIIVCQSKTIRAALRKYLISNDIFAPIHWQQPEEGIVSNDSKAIALSAKILTIPTDQRYGEEDIIRIVEILNDFVNITNH